MLVLKITLGVALGLAVFVVAFPHFFTIGAKVEVGPTTPVSATVYTACVSPVGEPTQREWCQNVLGDYNLNGIADRDE